VRKETGCSGRRIGHREVLADFVEVVEDVDMSLHIFAWGIGLW